MAESRRVMPRYFLKSGSPHPIQKASWWFQILFIFIPKIGEDEPILTSIFFKWVGSTTNQKNLFEGILIGRNSQLPNHQVIPMAQQTNASFTFKSCLLKVTGIVEAKGVFIYIGYGPLPVTVESEG